MHFPIKRGFFSPESLEHVKAVDGVSFYSIREGETLGLVGESGCGKTTTGGLIMRAYDSDRPGKSGSTTATRAGQRCRFEQQQLQQSRQNMQMIFQDPYSSLNPRMTLLEIVGEPLLVNKVAHGKELQERVAELAAAWWACALNTWCATRMPFPAGSASASGWRAPWRSTPS